jgi:hypothetical protein
VVFGEEYLSVDRLAFVPINYMLSSKRINLGLRLSALILLLRRHLILSHPLNVPKFIPILLVY